MPPSAHYSARLAEIAAAAMAAQSRSAEFSRLLALVAAIFLVLGYWVARNRLPIWSPISAAPFAAILWNARRKAQWQLYELDRLKESYDSGLARLSCDWDRAGDDGSIFRDRFQDSGHPYAGDLPLFGRCSLFQLMNTARTSAGKETVAAWMTHPASQDEAAARHGAVRELKNRIALRESLTLAGSSGIRGYKADTFDDWLHSPAARFPPHAPAVAGLLVAFTLLGLPLLALAGLIPAGSLLAVCAVALLMQGAFAWSLAVLVGRTIHDARPLIVELPVLLSLARILSKENFDDPLLRSLQQNATESLGPLSRLQRFVNLLEKRDADAFIMPCYMLLWGTQFAMAIERWRGEHGRALETWISALATFEALNAVACYAYEHPADPFPEFSSESPEFAASGLAHPLIQEDRAVGNTVTLDRANRFLLISGSNMSGKSTFLGTIGLNAILASMGAPVRAKKLRLSRLSLGTSIRIRDSIESGASQFLAEMKKISALLTLTEERAPVLFLIDEMMSGTNSRDRTIASEVVLSRLLDNGAIGLATTHDLALTEIAEKLPSAKNVHFEDSGNLKFDFQLKPGICRSSNGMAILELLGILPASGNYPVSTSK